MYYDSYYIIALIAVFILSLIAQSSVKSTFNKYSRQASEKGKAASNVAAELLANIGSTAVITRCNGTLTDHYDPRNNTVGLSTSVYDSTSIAALAVAAHEIGHVAQYQDGYGAIKLRNTILPVANIGSRFAPWLVILGLFLANSSLALVGVILFGAVLLFQLITLPVEFNASGRAIESLINGNFINYSEAEDAKKVLRAAAFTYVVAALSGLITMLRLLAIFNSTRRR